MNGLVRNTSLMSLTETANLSENDSDSDIDFCWNIQQKRRVSELVTENDVEVYSSDSDEESDFGSDNIPQMKRRKSLVLNEGGSSHNLSLPSWATTSWATEMSLLDKLTPGGRARAMGNVRIPVTPPVIRTPQEFKGINWKQLNFGSNRSLWSLGGSNRSLLSLVGSIPENNVITEEPEGEKGEYKADDYSAPNSCSRELCNKESQIIAMTDEKDENDEPFAKPLIFDDDEQSELPMNISNRSEPQSNMLLGEPMVDRSNLIVNYLTPEMNSTMLEELFSPYGTIVSSKVVVHQPSGFSKGYGFVKFLTESEGIAAQKAMHKYRIGSKTLKVSFARVEGEKTKHHTNLFISNLDPKLDAEDLERHFKSCGYVVDCKVLKDSNGVSKQFAFVRYGNSNSAQQALYRFNGKQLDGTDRPISVRIAKTPRAPSGRDSPSSCSSFKFPGTPPRVNQKSTSCYVTGFDVSLSEKVLRRLFASLGDGKVKNMRIIRRKNSPYAFINFHNCEDAIEAANKLNNTRLRFCILKVRLQM